MALLIVALMRCRAHTRLIQMLVVDKDGRYVFRSNPTDMKSQMDIGHTF